MIDQFGNNHMYLLSFRKSLIYLRIALKSLVSTMALNS